MASTQTRVRHQARQERSRRTEQRIVRATNRLLARCDFDEVSVADIAGEAGVSVGGVYARFPDKAALALAVEEQLLDTARRSTARAMGVNALRGRGAQDVVRAYVTHMVRFFHRNRGVLRHIAVRVRTDPRSERRGQVQAFNRMAHTSLRDRLLERSAEIGHPEPGRAIEFGVMMVSAAAREMVLFRGSSFNRSSAEGEELVRELTQAFCAYLDLGPRDNTRKDPS